MLPAEANVWLSTTVSCMSNGFFTRNTELLHHLYGAHNTLNLRTSPKWIACKQLNIYARFIYVLLSVFVACFIHTSSMIFALRPQPFSVFSKYIHFDQFSSMQHVQNVRSGCVMAIRLHLKCHFTLYHLSQGTLEKK